MRARPRARTRDWRPRGCSARCRRRRVPATAITIAAQITARPVTAIAGRHGDPDINPRRRGPGAVRPYRSCTFASTARTSPSGTAGPPVLSASETRRCDSTCRRTSGRPRRSPAPAASTSTERSSTSRVISMASCSSGVGSVGMAWDPIIGRGLRRVAGPLRAYPTVRKTPPGGRLFHPDLVPNRASGTGAATPPDSARRRKRSFMGPDGMRPRRAASYRDVGTSWGPGEDGE